MDLGTHNVSHGLENCESAFFEDMPMIVTSSPIEGKRGENSTPVTFRRSRPEDNLRWSDLLLKFQKNLDTRNFERKADLRVHDESPRTENCEITSSSCSYQPIAEHKMKILLTPGKKFQVLSSSARKIQLRQPTPKKPNSYSKLNHQYQQKLQTEESIETIKQKLKDAENMSEEDLHRYERVLKKYINQKETELEACSEAALVEESDLMKLIEKQLGRCNLSPRTVRMLGKQNQDQEKRLIGLSVAKRKSAVDVKKKINEQLVETKQQIKNREQLELKLVRAARLRHSATTSSLLFNKAHAAHHTHVVSETRQRNNFSRLQRQMQSEKMKSSSQVNRIVRDVWKTFLQEQYNELRKEVREHQQNKTVIVRESEANLKRLKMNYEEKLNELKVMAEAKAAEAGLEKKEIKREIERIQRNMQQQFQEEFQTLLRNIEAHGNHKRFKREEKASCLKEQLTKADFMFDV